MAYKALWPSHDVQVIIWTVAEYRRRYGAWPTQIRGAPDRAKAVITALTTEEVVALSEKADVRLGNRDAAWSVGGRGVVAYDGSWAGVLENSPEYAEAARWLALPNPQVDDFGEREILY